MKVLFVQPDCRDYRIPLFKNIADKFKTSLLHFGKRKFLEDELISETELRLRTVNSFKFIESLGKECNKYDCIITVFDPHWLNSFFLPFLTHTPVIFWGHGVGRSKIISYLRKITGKRARALITYYEEGKQNLVDIGLNPQKIFVAPNTIHVPNSQNYAQEEKNSILYVGRLQKRKDLDDLVKSFAQVHHRLPNNTILKILGDGDIVYKELASLGSKLGISEKIKFIKGTTEHDVLAQHFKQAYCYASPGHVGLGVLHSFAYGVPVITYKDRDHAPEVSNIKKNQNGLLVDGKEKQFGESLEWLINSGAYKKCGDNAYHHYSNNRTIENMVKGFKEAIEYCVER